MSTSDFDTNGMELRPTVIHWPTQVKSIVDGYRGYRGIAHGVQKDAIQNSWDARKHKKGQGWSVAFELVEGKGISLLVITDRGTMGLTGKILSQGELEKIDNLPGEERWSRFESLAFTKQLIGMERPLGSRGRGKFIFVGASKDYRIIYDTLREDGTYRFGVRFVTKVESPVAACDNDEARNRLADMSKGLLRPLKEVGTRVVIIDPIEEVVDAVKSGEFLKYICETWWEIIQKFGAKITVNVNGQERTATLPSDFVLPPNDDEEYKVWIRENEKIPAAGKDCRIKKLHVVYKRKGTVTEDIRGISIQRGGMKICPIEPRYLPRELAEQIYGYVTLDENVERLMLEDEGPEHYWYDYRKAIPGAVKRFVEEEIGKFAREKLGYGVDVRELRRQKQRDAERRALYAINRIAKAMGLNAPAPGPRSFATKSHEPRDVKEIRVRIPAPEFPRNNDIQIHYEESLKNIAVEVINESTYAVSVKLRMFLRFYDKVIKHYVDEDVSVGPGTTSELFGSFEEKFTEEEFPEKGQYTITARINSLMPANKGDKLDEKKISLYLEEEPPARGLFEKCDPIEYPEEFHLMAEAVAGEKGGFILQYNVAHPAQKAIEDNENDLAEYLFRLMAFELCRIDLQQEQPKLFEKSDKETTDASLQATLRLIGDFMYRYHTEV